LQRQEASASGAGEYQLEIGIGKVFHEFCGSRAQGLEAILDGAIADGDCQMGPLWRLVLYLTARETPTAQGRPGTKFPGYSRWLIAASAGGEFPGESLFNLRFAPMWLRCCP
jgi:hypothetical protein